MRCLEKIIVFRMSIIMNPYDILKDIYWRLSNVSIDGNSGLRLGERLKAIISYIDKEYLILDYFNKEMAEDYEIKTNKIQRVNIYIMKIIDRDIPTEIYLAHHDIVNPASDNVLDNTASISILLALANKIKGKKLNKNIVFALTDAEETCSFTSSGSARLARKINEGYFGNVTQVINLELTAFGDKIWYDGDAPFVIEYNDIRKVATPFSDTSVLLHYGIPSVVIGTLSEDELKSVIETGYCKTWGYCHSEKDSISLASELDMLKLCEKLETYCLSENR